MSFIINEISHNSQICQTPKFFWICRGLKTNKATSVFKVEKFSNLFVPDKLTINKNNEKKGLITTFDKLNIFPSVGHALIQEIKHNYDFKNTYFKNVNEMIMKPTPIQVCTFKKMYKMTKKNTYDTDKEKVLNGDEVNEHEVNKHEVKEHSKLNVFIVSAETGSGKTWAYLGSILSKLKEDEFLLHQKSKNLYENFLNQKNIRFLILLPTHELIDQVYDTLDFANRSVYDPETFKLKDEWKPFFSLKEQQSSLNFNIFKWEHNVPATILFDKISKERIDILITTPSKILSLKDFRMVEKPFRIFGETKYCVIDEADTLLDRSWFFETIKVLKVLKKCTDLIFCSATIPKDFKKRLSELFPQSDSIIPIMTPSLHKIPKEINVKMIDSSKPPYGGSKIKCFADLVYKISISGTESGMVKRILVFLNEKKRVNSLIHTMVTEFHHKEEDIIGITGDDTPIERKEKLKLFLKPPTFLNTDSEKSKIKILVTTDLLSRGLNFVKIKNVIILDFPKFSSDLIHRFGRTGRMKQSGTVFVIYDKKSCRSWVKSIPQLKKKNIRFG